MDWLRFRGHHLCCCCCCFYIFFLFLLSSLGIFCFPFFQQDPNNRERAQVYFCLMPKKRKQPLEMTNRLIRLVRPAAEPARLPWWLLDYLAAARPSVTEQLRRKCLWCFHFKALFLNIIRKLNQWSFVCTANTLWELPKWKGGHLLLTGLNKKKEILLPLKVSKGK